MHNFDHNSGKYLAIDDAKIYYEVIGDETAPVVVFLHGGFGTIENFNDIISKLPNNFRIIGIDSRGHGKSTLGSHALTYELLQNDVEAILKFLNINDVTIIGFSDGGTVGYRLASLSKLHVKKLLTIGSTWHIKNNDPLKNFYSKLTGDMWKAKYPASYNCYQTLNPEPNFNYFTEQLIKMWLDTSTSGHPNEDIENISCPVLAVRGETDPLISQADIVELTKIVKTTEHWEIQSAGHEAHKDQPDLFTKKLKEFLT